MKLATLHDGSRDGQLVVVSRDLASAHLASHIAGTLQQVLDDWNFLSPQLEDLYATLNGGKARHAFAFDPRACLAPLPRAFLWAPQAFDAAAAVPPLARSDAFLRPGAPAPASASPWAPLPQLVALTGDIAAGADADAALDGIRLLLLGAVWQAEGKVQASQFAPVAATPEELGSAWQAGRLTVPLQVPGRRKGGAGAAAVADDGASPAPGLGPRIAALACGRGLAAGSLVGSSAPLGAPGGLVGEALQLQLLAPDGPSVFGSLDLHLAARADLPGEPPAAATAPDASEPPQAPEPAP